MTISIKNKELHKKVFDKIEIWHNKAQKFYATGNYSQGQKYEKKTDLIYSKNYNKMFKVKKDFKL